ncbi:MAG: RadC family protein [Candidatus Woesearchaeota archaeon]
MKIKEISKSNRPRERLKEFGISSMSDIELLALILQTGTRDENVLEMSTRILSNNEFKDLSLMSYLELKRIKGIGDAKASKLISIFELFKRILKKERFKDKSIKLNSSEKVYHLLKSEMSDKKQEMVYLITLNTQNQLIKKRMVFKGSLNESVIHPRELFNFAIRDNSRSIIIAHNHPSNTLEPSQNDIEITRRIKKVGKIIGIDLLDHLIIINNNYFSFKEEGFVL